jgi:hypothetical protein
MPLTIVLLSKKYEYPHGYCLRYASGMKSLRLGKDTSGYGACQNKKVLDVVRDTFCRSATPLFGATVKHDSS